MKKQAGNLTEPLTRLKAEEYGYLTPKGRTLHSPLWLGGPVATWRAPSTNPPTATAAPNFMLPRAAMRCMQ